MTGDYLFHEDWSSISLIKDQFDYSWLAENSTPTLIAHALGASDSKRQNTLPEMRESLSKGLRLMEVDLWLDHDKIIRCHHGPDLPRPLQDSDCTFEKALKFASENQSWLILDIKTDFSITSREILQKISNEDSSRIIFQLYKPNHIQLFKEWLKEKKLAGPIITVYMAKRSVSHIQRSLIGSGFKALTVPSYRLPAIDHNEGNGIKIFTHPTIGCKYFLEQIAYGATGFYVSSEVTPKIQSGCIQ